MSRRNEQALLDSETGSDSDEEYPARRRPPPTPPPSSSKTTYIVLGMICLFLVLGGVAVAVAASKGIISFTWPTSESSSTSPSAVTVTEKPTGGGVSAPAATPRPTSAQVTGGGTGSKPTATDDEVPEASRSPPVKTSRPGSATNSTKTDDPDSAAPSRTKPPSRPSSTGSGSGGAIAVPEGATELAITFDSYTSGSVEEYLQTTHQMSVSDWGMSMGPINPQFYKENVAIVDGVLQLKCLAKQVDGKVSSAEVGLQNSNILYAHFTTRARATKVKGVCHGMFYYLDELAEIDIEILTSYIDKGLENGIQAVDKSTNVPYTWDPAADFHDYTIIWNKESTEFLVDGKSLAKFTESVPQRPGSLVWNNWSSGDPQWSAGPPEEDNIFEIQSITGWYTTG